MKRSYWWFLKFTSTQLQILSIDSYRVSKICTSWSTYLPSSYWVCGVHPAICTYDQHFCLRIFFQKWFLKQHVASQHPLQASSKHCVPAASDLRPERKSSNVASPKLQTSRLNSDTMWNTSRVHRIFEINSVGFLGGNKVLLISSYCVGCWIATSTAPSSK